MQGKIIISTQPADQAEKLMHLLREKGADAHNYPMIYTQSIQLPSGILKTKVLKSQPDLLIFTSRKGVKGFFENLHREMGNFVIPEKTKIAVVGKATAEKLSEYGHEATLINPGTTASDLARFLINNYLLPQHRIVLIQGNLAPDFLLNTLSLKSETERIIVYETHPTGNNQPHLDEIIRQNRADMIIFTSPSAFHSFVKRFPNTSNIKIAAIGNTTKNALEELGYPVHVESPIPDQSALAKAVEDYFLKEKQKSI